MLRAVGVRRHAGDQSAGDRRFSTAGTLDDDFRGTRAADDAHGPALVGLDSRSEQRDHLRLQHGGRGSEHLLRLGVLGDGRGRHHADHRQRRRADVQRQRRARCDARLAAVRARTTTARRRSPRPARPTCRAGPGGLLSQDDAGNSLQLQDATMRAQFNKTGTEQLPLDPASERPAGRHDRRAAATRARCSRAAAAWSSPTSTSAGGPRRSRTSTTKADPTHLPIYLTDSVLLYEARTSPTAA